jgi:hypothetical protein
MASCGGEPGQQGKYLSFGCERIGDIELGSLGGIAQMVNITLHEGQSDLLIISKGSKLNWKVFVTLAVATVSDDVPPGETARMWSPTLSILIYGERDAILVDTLTTTAQATALADWVILIA